LVSEGFALEWQQKNVTIDSMGNERYLPWSAISWGIGIKSESYASWHTIADELRSMSGDTIFAVLPDTGLIKITVWANRHKDDGTIISSQGAYPCPLIWLRDDLIAIDDSISIRFYSVKIILNKKE